MRKVYTASSLKTALKKIQKRKDISIDKSDIDLLKCPSESAIFCQGEPSGCQRGHFQSCSRSVKIYMNGNTKSCLRLSFRFTISDTNNDGYIEKNDLTLRWLISSKKLIDEKELVMVEV